MAMVALGVPQTFSGSHPLPPCPQAEIDRGVLPEDWAKFKKSFWTREAAQEFLVKNDLIDEQEPYLCTGRGPLLDNDHWHNRTKSKNLQGQIQREFATSGRSKHSGVRVVKLSKAEIRQAVNNKIASYNAEGLTNVEIGSRLAMDAKDISRRLRKMDLKPNNPTRDEVKSRRDKVLTLRMQGKTLVQIAAEIGCPVKTVSRDIHKYWENDNGQTFPEILRPKKKSHSHRVSEDVAARIEQYIDVKFGELKEFLKICFLEKIFS